MHSVPAAIRALLLTPRQEASKLGSPRYRLQISQYPLIYIGRPSDFIDAMVVSGLGVGGSAHQQAPSKHRRLRYRLPDIYITKRVLRCVRKDICVICGFSSDKGVAAYTSAGSIEARQSALPIADITVPPHILLFWGDFGLFGRKLYLNEF